MRKMHTFKKNSPRIPHLRQTADQFASENEVKRSALFRYLHSSADHITQRALEVEGTKLIDPFTYLTKTRQQAQRLRILRLETYLRKIRKAKKCLRG